MVTDALLHADLDGVPGVTAFTTLRHGVGESSPPFDRFNLGLRCGDAHDVVLRNRDALVRIGALPAPPRWLRQVHGTVVVRDPGADEPEADAATTRGRGRVLAVLTADCLPVVFAADDGGEVAAAHAGWRGLAAGVLEATVAAMDTPADRLVAWLGPAAGPRAYEVGQEVFDACVAHDPLAAADFIATRAGHWHVDLYALARKRLRAAGVRRITGGGLCTITDAARFFSHRRDARTGRMATLVWRT